jgi:hypothetical protein
MRFGQRVPAAVMIGKAAGAPVRNNVSHWVPGATFNNFSKDKNAEFLSWHRFVTARGYSSCPSNSDVCYSETASNAIPIVGTGKKVTKILVPLFGSTQHSEYNVGIYSATPSGYPGSQELAGGSTTPTNDIEYCCKAVRSVDVDITLRRGQKYFLEVNCTCRYCYGGWDMEDTDFSGNAQDYFRYRQLWKHYGGSHSWTISSWTVSSPWHLSTEYPEQPAAIAK